MSGISRGWIARFRQQLETSAGVARSLVARPDWMTALVTLAFVATILGAFIFDLHLRYRDAIAGAKALTQSYAQILSEHTARTFEAVDQIIQEAIAVRRDAIAGRYTTPQQVNDALRFLQHGSPVVAAIRWTDANGDVMAHSRDLTPQRFNIADQFHFKAQRDATDDQLVISPPFRSLVSNQWVTGATRRLTNPDGSFAGVVTAIVDQSYFRDTFRAVQIGPNDYVTLSDRNGLIISREPFIEGLVGRSFADGRIFSRELPRAASGAIETVSRLNGSSRITAFKTVPGFPLVVIVSADRADVLAPWRQHVYTFAPLVAIVVLLVLLGAYFLFRQTHALSDKTTLLNNVLSTMDEGMVVMDGEGGIRVCNRRAGEFLGLPATLTEKPFHIRDILAFQDSTRQAETWSAEARSHRDPRLHAGDLNVHERALQNGNVLEVRTVSLPSGGMVRTFTDITHRKVAEQAVSESEARYRLLADNSSDMIFRLDLAFVRRYVSPASKEILGFAPEELIGTKPVNQVHPEDAERVTATYQAVVHGQERASVTNRIRHRDGRWVWVEAELRLVRDEAGAPAGILGSLRDISVRKAIEAEAAEARKQAEAAAAAQGQFLATMSHELRTPLNGILGFADIVLERKDLEPEVRRQVGLIQTASSSLLMVVNDILDFSKIEEGKLELVPAAFSLAALIDNVVSIVRQSALKKHLDLRILTGTDVPACVVGDDGRLRQVLLNLLNNAIKFTHSGHIILAVERRAADAGMARLTFSVSDTGIGIREDQQHRLFQRFSQVDGSISREFGGTGLGLAISKRLVEVMGGEIGVDSVFGEGSTFWFTVTLPIASGADAPLSSSRAIDHRAGAARILLAEDVEMNQEIACTMLTAAGYQVDVVADGSDAIMAVATQGYDLVLMDIQMPSIDGLTATKRIRALQAPARDVPIIAMTANVLPQQIATFRDAGMNGHIGKPFRREDLLAVVDRHVRRTAEHSEPAADAATPAPTVLDADVFGDALKLMGEDKMNGILGQLKARLEGRFTTQPGNREERQRIAREAHSLVSSAGILGFTALSQSCARLEAACNDSEQDLAALLDRAREACHAALAEIDARLGRADELAKAL